VPEHEQNLSLPEDITGLGVEELNQFIAAASARMSELANSGTVELAAATAEADEMDALAGEIERVALEKARRKQVVAANRAKKAAAQARIEASDEDDEPDGEPDDEPDGEPDAELADDEPVTASKRPKGGAKTKPRSENANFRNPSLADAQRQAPTVPTRAPEPVLTASADIPNFNLGQKLDGMDGLVAAMQARARTLPITNRGDDAPRVPIASMVREFTFNLDPNATPAQINEVLTAAADPGILTAAGGWCSPSEIRYDFFNIVASDGAIDLPTVGINRGGVRWPTSPSFADVVLGNALWVWSETQDIAAVTGTAQSGTKTCGRVPCPSFNEARLGCDGVCLTVGNLTEDAYPELIANHTKLLFAAHAHKMNRKYIDAVRTLSAGFTVTNGTAGAGVVANVLGAIELQARDYRERYAMAEGSTLEVIAPRWLRGPMRSDLRRRMGATTDTLAATDAMLMGLFDAANVRIQWVNDYQVRTVGFPGVPGTLPTAWPLTVEFMMYAPGTVVKGNGLRLDLGIIRDSVLNATNDHTAEWMEECWLIFQPGHEVRRITVNICPDGTTGAADLTECGV